MGHLILSRRLNEAVVIRGSGETLVKVIEVGKDKVRLSFQAGAEIEIDRAEIRAVKDRDADREADRTDDGGQPQ